jgi:hypothetical protein
MPKAVKKDAATDLAEKMLQTLQEQRLPGQASFPTLRQLAERADPSATPEQVLKAVAKKKPFGQQAIAIQPRNLDSPVALIADAELLARSPAVLVFALELICTPAKPSCEIGKPKSKIPAKLKPAFASSVQQRLRDNDLPPGVAIIQVKRTKHFHLVRYELPKPPEVVLAGNLVRVLQAQRRLGGNSYPLTLTRLLELTQPEVRPALVKKAIAQPGFQEAVLQAVKNKPDAPVALTEDRELLLTSDVLLETLLKWTRKDTAQVCTLAGIKKKVVTSLQKPLEETLQRRIEDRNLPPTVGCLIHQKKPVLFLLSDVLTTPAANLPPVLSPPSVAVAEGQPALPAGPSLDFARAFDDVFQQLDRQRGSHNFLSLLDLRRALPVDRQTFDTGLEALRRAGCYVLSAAEGRLGLRPEEQEAAIRESGALLLYVSRKLS